MKVPRPREILSLPLAVVALAIAVSAAGPTPAAEAAPCNPPSVTSLGGTVTVEGTSCVFESENLSVYCSGGVIAVDYAVNGVNQGTYTSGVQCLSAAEVRVNGSLGGDSIDLSRVSSAGGFTGIARPNELFGGDSNDALTGSPMPDSFDGGPGSDLLLMRDGVADTGVCGPDFDFAQADAAALDTLSGCEAVDVPAPATPAVAATKKCKKKKKARAAKKRHCKKK